MARLADRHETLDVVDDQTGQPTWTMDVAGAILRLVDEAAPFGVWHATSQGETTKYGFTREIFRGLGLDPERVRPTTSDAFPLPAPRPAYSVLGHDSWRMARIPPLPPWQESLSASLAEVVGEPAPPAAHQS
jgi:dTDP-4-dehydrorhamnose reductase